MIGILDSGLGGLSIYKELKKTLPNQNFLYLADQNNFPYGTKSETELKRISKQNVEFLIDNDCDIIVTACNTITVNLIEYLRGKYTVNFVGVVPALNLALKETNNKKVGLLATDSTIASEYIESLLRDRLHVIELHKASGTKLIEKVEKQFNKVNDEDLDAAIEELLKQKVDVIVLGCTHFHFFKNRFKCLYPEINFIDPVNGVILQVEKVFKNLNKIDKIRVQDKFFTSGDLKKFQNSLAEIKIKTQEVYGL